MPPIPIRHSISSLDELLLSHRKIAASDHRGRAKVALDLDDAIEVIDPCHLDQPVMAAHRPLYLRHIRGQQTYLLGFKLLNISDSLLSGYLCEHNDLHDASIALRRAAARGH